MNEQENPAEEANGSLEVIDNDAEVTQEKSKELKIEPKKEKDPEQSESSKIGRIVKNQLEKETLPLREEITNLRETVERLTPKEKVDALAPPVEGFPTTPEEFIAMNKWAKQVENENFRKERVNYEQGYISSINKLREEGGELHAQIQDLLTKDGSPYNVTRGTGRGDVDAELNYRIAHRDILANKIKTSGNPFKGGNGEIPTGVSASSRVPTPSVKKVKFDDEKAEEFAQFLKLNDEERAKVISGR
jgi:hypothetical protein